MFTNYTFKSRLKENSFFFFFSEFGNLVIAKLKFCKVNDIAGIQ